MSELLEHQSIDELKQTSKIIADILLQPTHVEYKQTITIQTVEIVEVETVNLDLLASATAGITDPIGQLSSFISGLLNSIASWIVSAVSSAISITQSVIMSGLSALTILVSSGVARLESIISGVTSAISGITTTISSIIYSAISTISSTILSISSSILSAISSATSTITSTLSSIVSNIISIISSAISSAISTISSIISSISSFISGMASSILSAISSAISSISSLISGVISAISGVISAVSGVISSAVSTISSFISGMASSILSAISGVLSAISGVISTAISTISGAISGVVSAISSAISGFASTILSAFHSAISTISSTISGIAATISSLISTAISTVSSLISSAISTISSAISGFASTILSAFHSAISTISGAISGVISAISTQVSNIWNLILDTFTKMAGMIKSGFEFITRGFTGFINAIMQLPDRFRAILEEIGKWIWNAIPDWVRNAIESIRKFFTEDVPTFFTKTIPEFIGYVRKFFTEDVPTFLTKTLPEFLNAVRKFFTVDVPDFFTKTFPEFMRSIPSVVETFTGKLKAILEEIGKWIWNAIPDWIKNVFENIGKFLSEDLVNFFTKTLPEFLNAVRKFFTVDVPDFFTKTFPEFMRSIPSVVETFTGKLKAILEEIGKWIWNAIPDWIKNTFTNIAKFFTEDLINFFTKTLPELFKPLLEALQNFLKDPVGWLTARATEIQEWLWSILPQPVKDYWKWKEEVEKKIYTPERAGVESTLWREIGEFISKPVDYISEKIIPVVIEGFTFLVNASSSFFETIKNVVSGMLDTVKTWVVSLLGTVSGWINGLISEGMKHLGGFFDTISKLILTPISNLASGYLSGYRDWLGKALKGEAGELGVISGVLVYTFPAYLGLRAAPTILRALAGLLRGVRVNLRPFGLGVELPITWGRILYEAGILIDRATQRIPENLMFWTIYQTLDPLRTPYRYTWRLQFDNFGWLNVPIEPTPIEMSRDIARRFEMDKQYIELVTQLKYHGLPKWFIDGLTQLVDKEKGIGYITVKDRFNQDRIVPLALIYDQPSPSELARWMVRDLFGTGAEAFERFSKWAYRLGLYPDTSVFYYLMAFRYPPPRTLWDTVIRGVTGFLWYIPSREEIEDALNDAKAVKGFTPTPPPALNFQYSQLFRALTSYMKWHDYARHGWIDGFTSDNWLVIDHLARLPGRRESRWTAKWGLFQILSERGVTLESPVYEFTYKLIEDKAVSNIQLDNTLFNRLIQTTGLHPYLNALVSTSEMFEALTDERTLVRTGYINIYKEGLWTPKDLEELLAGFFKVSFKTSFFDIFKRKWIEGWVNMPVMYLPPERKLLTLRAVFDRAVDLFRDFMRIIVTGLLNLVYISSVDYEKIKAVKPEEEKYVAEKVISKFVNNYLNPWFKTVVKEITGVERSLVIDEEWIKIFTQYASTVRDVETYIRSRYYLRYLYWRALDRHTRGFITREETLQYIRKMVEISRESPLVVDILAETGEFVRKGFELETKANAVLSKLSRRVISEAEALKTLLELGLNREIAESLIEIRSRPYVPAPVTYGVMMEIVPEASEIVERMIEVFAFPEWERKYWEIYFKRKPYADELTLLRTRIYNALSEKVPPEEIVEVLGKWLKPVEISKLYDENRNIFLEYGVLKREWELYGLIAVLEQMIDKARTQRKEFEKEYIPTPIMLATLSEYIPLPREIILEALKYRGVKDIWLDFWMKYIEAKPLVDDVKALISTYRRALLYVKIPEEIEKQILSLARQIGYTDRELSILQLRVQLEEMIMNTKEYTPTPGNLATLSEYITLPASLIVEVLRRRGIPEEWVKIWLTYITVKPLKTDAKQLLSAYIRALRYDVVKKEDFDKFLNTLVNYGFTPPEIALIRDRVNLELLTNEAVENRREYIPTPLTLATLCEYLPEAREFYRDVAEAKRIPERWRELWARYIDIRPLIDDVKKYLSRAEQLYVRFMIPKETFIKVLREVGEYLGYTPKEVEFLMKITDFERHRVAWTELIGDIDRMVMVSEYSPKAMDFALGTMYKMIDALPVDEATKKVLKEMWEQYIRVRPVKEEVKRYVTDLINLYVEGLISDKAFSDELESLKQWGLSSYEITFYKAMAGMRRARKLKIVVG